VPVFFSGIIEENTKNIRIISVPAEVRTVHFPKTRQKCRSLSHVRNVIQVRPAVGTRNATGLNGEALSRQLGGVRRKYTHAVCGFCHEGGK
jgi:hypothetical protein